MDKIKAAIIGASGYTGEALIELLLHHPFVDVTCITSREHDGKNIGEVYSRFSHFNLSFISPDVDKIIDLAQAVFICLPHGLSAEYAIPLYNKGLKIFDLGADFRLKSFKDYQTYYDMDHPAADMLTKAAYGLPEKNRDQISSASLIACPGCYPTTIILPILPFLTTESVTTELIIACSMSGVSGAGKKAAVPLLFAECNESVRSYNVVGHRHTAEIEQELNDVAGTEAIAIEFTPTLVPTNRGINSVIYLNASSGSINSDNIYSILHSHYKDEPFIRILPQGRLADTKNVTFTNTIEIGFAFNERTRRITLTSALDNLIKGAAGQAVQCMNLAYGFSERSGLRR